MQHRLLTFGVLLLYVSTDETRAQPLTTAQQYLRDLVGGDRLQSLPYSAESSLVSDLLAVIPTEPVQFAGQCNVTYDATAYEEDRHVVLLPPVCTSDDARLPDADSIWQVRIFTLLHHDL